MLYESQTRVFFPGKPAIHAGSLTDLDSMGFRQKDIDEMVRRGLFKPTEVVIEVSPAVVVTEESLIARAEAIAAPSEPKPKEPININSASIEQLEALDGIGSTTAIAIKNGQPYRTLAEVPTKAKLPPRLRGQWDELSQLFYIPEFKVGE